MMTTTIETNDARANNQETQQSSKRRPLRSELISVMSLACLLLCSITIGCCTAFNIVQPYSNRALGRLQGTSSSSSSSSASSTDGYDRQEFEMQVGRAMDTLRDDYPEILVKDPGKYSTATFTIDILCALQKFVFDCSFLSRRSFVLTQ